MTFKNLMLSATFLAAGTLLALNILAKAFWHKAMESRRPNC